jgi:hypothetical protein
MIRPMSSMTLTAFLDGFALSGFLTRARWPGAPVIGFQPSMSEFDDEGESERAAARLSNREIAAIFDLTSQGVAEMMAERPDLTIKEMKEILLRTIRESSSVTRSERQSHP